MLTKEIEMKLESVFSIIGEGDDDSDFYDEEDDGDSEYEDGEDY
jgi:hypothetical protein